MSGFGPLIVAVFGLDHDGSRANVLSVGCLRARNTPDVAVDMCVTCKHVHNMSKMIQIRHVPEALHRALRARAARAGMTLSDYLRGELARAVEQLTPDELRERLASLEPAVVREPPARAVRRERDRE